MTQIDYDALNAEPTPLGRARGEGRLRRYALPLLMLAGAGAIGWLVYLDGQRGPGRLTDRDHERFEPPGFQPRDMPDAQARRQDQITVERATPTPPATAPPPTVIQQGPDLEAQRRLLEEQRLLEEARRRAEEEARTREEERRRREEAEKARWERLRSPLIVVDEGAAGAVAREAEPGAAASVRAGEERDPNRAFLNQVGNEAVEVSRATRNRRIDALVAQGTMIRGILETAIQSDLPGQVRAVTAEDVWSFDGRRVLIPAGTRLIGEYRSGLARGQTRIFIVWTRLLRADGVSVALGSIGTDDLGRAGLTGTVDNRYVERFGSAILLSVVGGAAQFIAGLGNANQQTSGPIQIVDPVTGQITMVQTQPNQLALNARQIGAQTTAQTLTQLAQEALRDQIAIPQTVHVDQGARIMIFVRRDLDFSALYPDPVREEMRRLQAGGRSPQRFDPTLPPPGAPLSITPPAATRVTKP
jgi:type IV secretion system protein VirB10